MTRYNDMLDTIEIKIFIKMDEIFNKYILQIEYF